MPRAAKDMTNAANSLFKAIGISFHRQKNVSTYSNIRATIGSVPII